MKHIVIAVGLWGICTVALGIIARVTYLVFMIGWGLV